MVKLVDVPRPFVVGVVVERNLAAARRATEAAFRDGAAAAELNLAALPDDQLPGHAYFNGLRHPVYTSCRRARFMRVYGAKFASVPARFDIFRMECQLDACLIGAAGLDLEADTYAPSRDEWTDARDALHRQKEVIAAVHLGRRAAIASWHPPRKLTFAQAYRAARVLRERGVDFVKIVERVRTVTEALDSLHISLRLREKLDFPFVFLPLGPGAEQVRPYMTAFGAAYLLARPPIGSNRLPAQPLVTRARALVDLA